MGPLPSRSQKIKPKNSDGAPDAAFSLLEMMTVLALLLIFASFALPTYQNIVLRMREAALRNDLYTLRSMVDRFTLDTRGVPPSMTGPRKSPRPVLGCTTHSGFRGQSRTRLGVETYSPGEYCHAASHGGETGVRGDGP